MRAFLPLVLAAGMAAGPAQDPPAARIVLVELFTSQG